MPDDDTPVTVGFLMEVLKAQKKHLMESVREVLREIAGGQMTASPATEMETAPSEDQEASQKKKPKNKKKKKKAKIEKPEEIEDQEMESAEEEEVSTAVESDVVVECTTPPGADVTTMDVAGPSGLNDTGASTLVSSPEETSEVGFEVVSSRSRKRKNLAEGDKKSSTSDEEALGKRPKAKANGSAPRIPPPRSTRTPGATERIPPVILRTKECSASWTQVSALMRNRKISYAKAKTTEEGIRIQPQSADDYRAMTRLFESEKLPFHSFLLKSEKGLRVVIKGLDRNISEDDVKSDLTEQGFNPVQVKRLSKNKSKLDMVVIEVPREERRIYDLTKVCDLVTTMESQKRTKSAIQCHRCQKWGHGQRGCRAAPRCVKCAGEHESRDCQVPRSTKAKCANCGGAHPASHRGCPKWPSQGAKKGNAVTGAAAKTLATTGETSAAPRLQENFPALPKKAGPKTGRDQNQKVLNTTQPGPSKWNSGAKTSEKTSGNGKEPNPSSVVCRMMGQLWLTFGEANPTPELFEKFDSQCRELSSYLKTLYGK